VREVSGAAWSKTRRLRVRQRKLVGTKSQCEGQRRRSDVVNSGWPRARTRRKILLHADQICAFAIVFLTQRRFRRRMIVTLLQNRRRNGIYRAIRSGTVALVNIRRGDVCTMDKEIT
jgi:hypothetical protein